MAGRNLWFIAILVTAVVVPYHLSGDAQWSSINNWWQSMWSTAEGDGYEGVTNDSYRKPWPGPPPMAATSPLPANSARRRNARTSVAPDRASPALPGANDLPLNAPVALSAKIPRNTNQVRRPQFHDWMPVDPTESSAPTRMPGSGPGDETSLDAPQPRLCGPIAPNFSQLLRFDITAAWVMDNWQRVSTRLAEFELEGLRVPVVTGTEVDDLVGTLTYYFDGRKTLQRISFDGFTGDPATLVGFMTNQFGMQVEPWLGAGLYVNRDQADQLASVMRIVHAPIIRSTQARKRYAVEFELNRPESKHGLSQHFTSLIEADRNSRALETDEDGTSVSSSEESENNDTDAKAKQPTGEKDKATLASDTAGSENPKSPVPPKPLVQPKPLGQPKPLNGSQETDGGLSEGSGKKRSGLYPSQLPSNWQRYVPPR